MTHVRHEVVIKGDSMDTVFYLEGEQACVELREYGPGGDRRDRVKTVLLAAISVNDWNYVTAELARIQGARKGDS